MSEAFRRLAILARIGVIVEVAGTAGLAVLLLLTDRHQDPGVIFQTSGAGAGDYTGAFLAAILAGVWVFYGFEACGDIAAQGVAVVDRPGHRGRGADHHAPVDGGGLPLVTAQRPEVPHRR